MIIQSILPDKVLKPFIDCFLYIKDNEKRDFMFLPDNINVLTFQLSGNTNAQYSGTFCSNISTKISGAFTDKRYFETSGAFEVIMVFMKPFAIHSLFSVRLSDFKNEIISLSDIAKQSQVAELHEKMNNRKSYVDKIQLIEGFFKKYTGISPGRFVKTDLNNKQIVDFLQLYAETVE